MATRRVIGLVRVDDGFEAVSHPKFAINAGQVLFHGDFAKVQGLGDGAVLLATLEPVIDFLLAFSEWFFHAMLLVCNGLHRGR